MTDPDPSPQAYGHLSMIRWMLGLCWQRKYVFGAAIVFQIGLALFGVLGLNLIGVGIDYLSYILGEGGTVPRWPLGWEPPAGWPPLAVAAALAAGTVAAALGSAVLAYAAATATARLVHGQVAPQLQNQVFAKLQGLCLRFYGSRSTGSVINRATGDVQAVRSFVDTALMEAVVLTVLLVVFAVYMARIHFLLTVACLSVTPLMVIASAWFSRRTRPLFLAYRESFDRMILYLSETIRGMAVIKGFSMEAETIGRMRRKNAELWDRQQAIFRRLSIFAPSVNIMTHLSLFILLVYGGRLVARGELPLGSGLVVFAGLLQQFANRITNVAQIANSVQESLTGARRIHDILRTDSSVEPPLHPKRPEPFRARVAFERVSLRFGDGEAALQSVSFEANEGETIALTGETGSGKSALLSLIPRLYDPDGGRVLIGGYDARELDLDWLRRQVGVVFQDSFLFNATIAENIRFGHSEATMDEVRKAAEIACASEFIDQLEEGYDTMIGEMGINLSGGQRQRLAIARAILTDPPILLLDDPTSAIDAATETLIMKAMRRAMSSRTTFIVANRLATLATADRILVLEKGSIAQEGTPAELLARPGLYRRLAQSQLSERPDLASVNRAKMERPEGSGRRRRNASPATV